MSHIPVALLGVGTMGVGMGRRLLKAGFSLTVYNRNPAKAETLKADGARVAATPREAVAGSMFVVSMLSDDDASRSVWLGRDGALAGVVKSAVLIESSTVSVGWVRELAAAAQKSGCSLLDAPVTGSKVQAANGELVFLVGGDAGAVEKARPVLAAMSRDVVHLGPTGSGALLKLINNFACGVQLASLVEAIAMIERAGLDREKSMALLTNGNPGSPFVKTMASRILAGDYTTNFSLNLMAKDLWYAHAEAAALSLDLKTAEAASAVMQAGIDAGLGNEDLSAVAKALRLNNPT